jgi:hypothetical protein
MKTAAQHSFLVSLGSWVRAVMAVVRRESKLAFQLHLQNCEALLESHRRH